MVSRSPPGISSRRSQGSPRFLGGPQCVHALGCYPGGSPVPGPYSTEEIAFRLCRDVGSPILASRGRFTTACTLAVYASQRRVTPTPRKTRFRWVASPYRVGFSPTGSTTKGFRSCLLHFPSPLPRLGLARGVKPGASAPGPGATYSPGAPKGRRQATDRLSCLRPFGALGLVRHRFLGLKPQALCPRPFRGWLSLRHPLSEVDPKSRAKIDS